MIPIGGIINKGLTLIKNKQEFKHREQDGLRQKVGYSLFGKMSFLFLYFPVAIAWQVLWFPNVFNRWGFQADVSAILNVINLIGAGNFFYLVFSFMGLSTSVNMFSKMRATKKFDKEVKENNRVENNRPARRSNRRRRNKK